MPLAEIRSRGFQGGLDVLQGVSGGPGRSQERFRRIRGVSEAIKGVSRFKVSNLEVSGGLRGVLGDSRGYLKVSVAFQGVSEGFARSQEVGHRNFWGALRFLRLLKGVRKSKRISGVPEGVRSALEGLRVLSEDSRVFQGPFWWYQVSQEVSGSLGGSQDVSGGSLGRFSDC